MSLTISLIAVLIPLLFMGDIVGRLFREFAVTLALAILISAFISLTLTPILILTALIAVYLVLGALYESYIHPVTILSTLPSAGIGAVLVLLIVHMEFDIIALIGVVLLIGIVKRNAIMMIDFAWKRSVLRSIQPKKRSSRPAAFVSARFS